MPRINLALNIPALAAAQDFSIQILDSASHRSAGDGWQIKFEAANLPGVGLTIEPWLRISDNHSQLPSGLDAWIYSESSLSLIGDRKRFRHQRHVIHRPEVDAPFGFKSGVSG